MENIKLIALKYILIGGIVLVSALLSFIFLYKSYIQG